MTQSALESDSFCPKFGGVGWGIFGNPTGPGPNFGQKGIRLERIMAYAFLFCPKFGGWGISGNPTGSAANFGQKMLRIARIRAFSCFRHLQSDSVNSASCCSGSLLVVASVATTGLYFRMMTTGVIFGNPKGHAPNPSRVMADSRAAYLISRHPSASSCFRPHP